MGGAAPRVVRFGAVPIPKWIRVRQAGGRWPSRLNLFTGDAVDGECGWGGIGSGPNPDESNSGVGRSGSDGAVVGQTGHRDGCRVLDCGCVPGIVDCLTAWEAEAESPT
jgi:hypothetical protein